MVIEADNVSVYFSSTLALDRLTFRVGAGETVGFLGMNGAGKSTAMRVLAGFIAPSDGTVRIMDKDPASPATRQNFGYLPESNPLPKHMRVREYLEFRAKLRGLPRSQARKRTAETTESCNLSGLREQLIKSLSKGQRQRVGFAEAIIARPPVLLLDEPNSGLDPEETASMRSFLKNLPPGVTLFLSSHRLAEVEALCRRVIIINHGRVVADESVKTVCETNIDHRVVVFEILSEEPIRETLRSIPGIKSLHIKNSEAAPGASEVRATTPAGVDLRREIALVCAQRGWLITNMRQEPPSLEDVFRKIAKGNT